VRLRIGSSAIPARFEGGHTKEEKMAAVQYLRFPVPQACRPDLADPGRPVHLVVDHPNYQAEEVVHEALRREMLKDLEG